MWSWTPSTRTIGVCSPEGTVTTVGRDETLDGLDVLPGFLCGVSAVLETQSPEPGP